MASIKQRTIPILALAALTAVLAVTSCEAESAREPEPVEYSEETQELLRIAAEWFSDPIERAEALLTQGADPNSRRDFTSRRDSWPTLTLRDAPVLSIAARKRWPLTIQALLEAGADVNARDGSGATALHYAMYQADHNDSAVTEVLELLLENGADPNIATYDDGESRFRGEGQYRDGHAPLYGASQALSTDWVRVLISNGADVNARLSSNPNAETANGETALHVAISATSSEQENEMRMYGVETVSILLEAGADPNIRRATHGRNSYSDGATPLYQASVFDISEIVSLLLGYEADPTIPTSEVRGQRTGRGTTTLHAAKSAEVAQMLIHAGAKIDAERQDGTRTRPISIAAAGGFTDVIEVLLQHGADINYVAERGTPVDYAIHYRQHDTVEYLRSRGGLSREELQESE